MGLDTFLYRLRRKGELAYLTLTGKSNGTVTVLIKDDDGKILMAKGTTVPSDGGAVYAKGCVFIKTDAADTARAWYENIGTTASCNFEQGAFADATVDSKITSMSVIVSSNLVTGDSKATSLSSLVHTADSKAVSNSVVISSNLVTGDSKALSLSTLTATADSKAVSNSVIISSNLVTSNSKANSLSTLVATADSKAVSVSVIASANLVTSDSKAASLSTLLSTLDSKVASYHA